MNKEEIAVRKKVYYQTKEEAEQNRKYKEALKEEIAAYKRDYFRKHEKEIMTYIGKYFKNKLAAYC